MPRTNEHEVRESKDIGLRLRMHGCSGIVSCAGSVLLCSFQGTFEHRKSTTKAPRSPTIQKGKVDADTWSRSIKKAASQPPFQAATHPATNPRERTRGGGGHGPRAPEHIFSGIPGVEDSWCQLRPCFGVLVQDSNSCFWAALGDGPMCCRTGRHCSSDVSRRPRRLAKASDS